ncbi:MAG: flagellum-specific ATP synthase FliI, partial [Hyphomicrobiales bacterium]
MNGARPGQDRLSTLATMIGELEATSVYGRVTAVRGLLVEVSGPIAAMSLGGRVGIEIAAGVRVPCEVIGFSGEKALVMPFGGLDGVRRGCPAYVDRTVAGLRPTMAWLGRVVDALGRPVDGGPPLPQGEHTI